MFFFPQRYVFWTIQCLTLAGLANGRRFRLALESGLPAHEFLFPLLPRVKPMSSVCCLRTRISTHNLLVFTEITALNFMVLKLTSLSTQHWSVLNFHGKGAVFHGGNLSFLTRFCFFHCLQNCVLEFPII